MYQLPRLPYLYQDLEPFIDTHTMGLHYNKHQKNYINQLNNLLKKNNYDYRYNINELIYHIKEFKPSDRGDILYNLGGVLNHNLYWKSMNNNERKQLPLGKLRNILEKEYGSYENFKKIFKNTALKLKGSGYTFLVLKGNKLDIINLPNQETPLSYGLIPLFTIDMWEHAYYLNYEYDKAKYLDNFFEIADFTYANQILNK